MNIVDIHFRMLQIYKHRLIESKVIKAFWKGLVLEYRIDCGPVHHVLNMFQKRQF